MNEKPQLARRPQAAPQAQAQTATAQSQTEQSRTEQSQTARPVAGLLPSIKTRALAAAVAAALVGLAITTLAPATDELTPDEDQARLEAFSAAVPLPLPLVKLTSAAELKEAFQSLGLSQAEQQALQLNLQANQARLVWLDVFDNCQEDGDIVAIRTLEYHREIPILHAPTRFAVPVSTGEQAIMLTGIQDGGGGITVAIRVEGRTVPVPRLRPGETLSIPIAGIRQ